MGLMSDRTEPDGTKSIRAVERAFEVVEALETLGEARLTELATEMDVPTSTLHTYLQTLVRAGYVRRDGDSYALGLRFLKHGGHARRRLKIHQVARSRIDALARETNEVAALGVEEGGQRVLLYKSEGNEAVYDNAPTGEFTQMHWSALGKALLSGHDRDAVERIVDSWGLPERTGNTITDREALFEELAGIRERGYSLEDEERRVGIRSVGVPLSDDHDRVIGAISVSGPKNRFDDDWIADEGVPRLQNAANVIELQYIHD